MIVSITHYDDITAPGGDIVTMYMIMVQYSTKSSYCLAKRYSDFSDLYAVVKDYLPNDYKFPNKSLFHNNAQFTKERRLRGFDELLKLCAKYLPLHPDFQTFLEMKENMSAAEREAIAEQVKAQALSSSSTINYSAMSKSTSNTSVNTAGSAGGGIGGGASRRATIKSVSLKSTLDFQNSGESSEEFQIRQKLSKLSQFLLSRTTDPEENLTIYELQEKEQENNFRYQFQKVFPELLFKVLKKVGLVYLVLIILSIIDLSVGNYAKIFYCFTSMTMIFLFLEVKKIRNNLPKNKEQNKESKKSAKKALKSVSEAPVTPTTPSGLRRKRVKIIE